MPFSETFDEVFKHAITPAAESRGYHCERMDQVAGTINLIHEMIKNIYEADLIVADLTSKSANVFYELGVAHSVPVPNKVVMIAQQDEEIPFDIGPYQVLKYNRSYEGIVSLREGIAQRIEFIETNSDSTTNPVQDFLQKQENRPKQKIVPLSDSKEDPLTRLYISQIRLSLLHYLNNPMHSGLTITNICRALGIQRRKFGVLVLQELVNDGLIEREKKNQRVIWRISAKGKVILGKLGKLIDSRIELSGSKK